MKNVNYIIGNSNTLNKPFEPFHKDVCDFLNEISASLLKSGATRKYTDLSALSFWARRANIQKLKENFDAKGKIGRGLCFHIAPSNIPINSIFSFFFGLLAGNSNIVRLSGKNFPQVDFVCDLIKKTLENYPEIKARTAFIKYERDNEISEEFSKIADVRMIWGGDKTIKLFKSFEVKPRCTDITFPDRYSACIIDANKILKKDETSLLRLFEGFYNDTYLMDQNACSSPQIIFWKNDNKKAREIFWQGVYNIAKEKYELQDAICVDKYTKLCEDTILFENVKSVQKNTNLLYRSELSSLSNIENIRGRGGYFYEYALFDIKEFYNVITDRWQTITYFGIDPNALQKGVIENNLLGIDRIVPIGKAMDIGTIWDGHDLLNELSRVVSLC